MKDMPIALSLNRQREMLCPFQTRRVARGPLSPIIIPFINVFQLGAENPRMNIIQPAVESVTMNVSRI